MRFIAEFELVPPAIEQRIDAYKSRGNLDLGCDMSESFGWKCKGEVTLKAIGSEIKERWTLEIEAFPMDKWVEFKKRFADALPDYDTVSRTRLINALAALEEFHGKPSVDAITNPK